MEAGNVASMMNSPLPSPKSNGKRVEMYRSVQRPKANPEQTRRAVYTKATFNMIIGMIGDNG